MADEELPPSFTNASATLLDSLFGRALSTAHQLLQPNQVPVCIICSFILCMCRPSVTRVYGQAYMRKAHASGFKPLRHRWKMQRSSLCVRALQYCRHPFRRWKMQSCSLCVCAMQYRSPPAYAPCAHCQCSLQELVSLYQSKENAIHEFDRAVDTRHQMYLEQLQEIAIQVRKVLKTLVPQFYAPLDQLAPDISVRSVSGTHGRVQ